MKKAGKIIAAIFASINIVVALIQVVVGLGGQFAQDNPELIQESMEQATANMPEEQAAVQPDIDALEEQLGNLDFSKATSQGIVGAILSVIILVTVLINVSSMPFITPAIASVAALGGAIYCGWFLMPFMVLALIGSVLVLLANLKAAKDTS